MSQLPRKGKLVGMEERWNTGEHVVLLNTEMSLVDSWKGYGGGVAIQTNPIPSQIRRPTQLGTC